MGCIYIHKIWLFECNGYIFIDLSLKASAPSGIIPLIEALLCPYQQTQKLLYHQNSLQNARIKPFSVSYLLVFIWFEQHVLPELKTAHWQQYGTQNTKTLINAFYLVSYHIYFPFDLNFYTRVCVKFTSLSFICQI